MYVEANPNKKIESGGHFHDTLLIQTYDKQWWMLDVIFPQIYQPSNYNI